MHFISLVFTHLNKHHSCKEHDIEYQSFWTLTANPDAYRHPDAIELAKRKGLSPERVRVSAQYRYVVIN